LDAIHTDISLMDCHWSRQRSLQPIDPFER
jgi:hypothetical protein